MSIYTFEGAYVEVDGGSLLVTGEATPVEVELPDIGWHPAGDEPEGTYLRGTLPALPTGMTHWEIQLTNPDAEFTFSAGGEISIPLETVTEAKARQLTVFCRNDTGTGFLARSKAEIEHKAKPASNPDPNPTEPDITDADWALEPAPYEAQSTQFPGEWPVRVRIPVGSPLHGNAQFMVWTDVTNTTDIRPPCVKLANDANGDELWEISYWKLENTWYTWAPGETAGNMRVRVMYDTPPGTVEDYRANHDGRQAYIDLMGAWSLTTKETTIPPEYADGPPVTGRPAQLAAGDWRVDPGVTDATFIPYVDTAPDMGDGTLARYEASLDNGAAFTVTLGVENAVDAAYAGKIGQLRLRAVNSNEKAADFSEPKELTFPGTDTGGSAGEPADTFSASSLTFADGTAQFNQTLSSRCFRYWDGTPGVLVGAGSLTGWSPTPSTNRHGLMVDPPGPSSNNLYQGFDDRDMNQDEAPFDSTLNVAPELSGNSAIALNAEKSIVKASSWVTSNPAVYPSGEGRGWDTPIKRHDTIYVVNDLPPKRSFKPSNASRTGSKASEATTDDIDWSKIPNLTLRRRPSQDKSWMTLANIVTGLNGHDLNYGNTVPFSWSGGTIDGRGIYGRENTYGASSWYPSYFQHIVLAAMCYCFDSGLTKAQKEPLVHGLFQLGYWHHKWMESNGSTNVFHGEVFNDILRFSIAVLKDGALRDRMILSLGKTREQTYYVAQSHVDLVPPEGTTPDARGRYNAGPTWPYDEPWMPEHIGFPWYGEMKKSNANWGGRLWPHKNAIYHQERSTPYLIGQIAGAVDPDILPAVNVHQHDRINRIWSLHFQGIVPISLGSHSETNYKCPPAWAPWRWLMEFGDDFRDRIEISRWVGPPERPDPPILSRSGSTVTAICLRAKYDNGRPITQGRIRARSSTSRDYSTGGWTTVDTFTPNAAGEEQTRQFTWNGSFPLQVRLDYYNGAWGPSSGNWPFFQDASADAPGRYGSGNRGQVS